MLRPRSLLLALLGLLLLAAPAAARVPANWSGVMVDYPKLLLSPEKLRSELGVMHANHVGRIRFALYWSGVQPYHRMADVPEDQQSRFTDEDGVPTDLSRFDTVVADATRAGLGVLPVVLDAPPWAAGSTPHGIVTQPRGTADYARFLTTLVRRYGPDGTFWADHPELPRRPLRQWQIWNEPNLSSFWRRPWVPGYTALLKASYRAVHAVDPRAQVVTAALTADSWNDLRRLYQAHVKGFYDVLGLNTFTRYPRNLVTALEYNRRVQTAFHDPRPMMLTEITYDASRGHTDFQWPWSTRPPDQAAKLTQAYTQLARVRRKYDLLGVFWYAWMTGYTAHDPFDYSGLRMWHDKGAPTSKSLLATFRRVLGRL